jgi:hypothetical protein
MKTIKKAKIEIINSERSNFDLIDNKLSFSSGVSRYKHIDLKVYLDGKCILSTVFDNDIHDIIYPQKQNFIDYFVEEYNKGNILKEIDIEVEEIKTYSYNLLKKL